MSCKSLQNLSNFLDPRGPSAAIIRGQHIGRTAAACVHGHVPLGAYADDVPDAHPREFTHEPEYVPSPVAGSHVQAASESGRGHHAGDGPSTVEGPDPGMGYDDVIEDNDGNEDADMGAVQEDQSEEEMGIVHEDIEN